MILLHSNIIDYVLFFLIICPCVASNSEFFLNFWETLPQQLAVSQTRQKRYAYIFTSAGRDVLPEPTGCSASAGLAPQQTQCYMAGAMRPIPNSWPPCFPPSRWSCARPVESARTHTPPDSNRIRPYYPPRRACAGTGAPDTYLFANVHFS